MRRVRFLSIISLFAILGETATVAHAQAHPLLDSAEHSIVEHATRVTASPLKEMAKLPSAMPPPTSSREISESQKKKLISLLKKSWTIDVRKRLSQCTYLPGAKFTFMPGNLTVLLCLNCDVWALTNEPEATPQDMNQIQQLKFGDNSKDRQNLNSLLKDIFGDTFFDPKQQITAD